MTVLAPSSLFQHFKIRIFTKLFLQSIVAMSWLDIAPGFKYLPASVETSTGGDCYIGINSVVKFLVCKSKVFIEKNMS